jgi:hypothetical protein
MPEMTHEEMLEEAARREKENEVIVAKVSDEDYQKILNEAECREQVIEIGKRFIEENSKTLEQLAEIERKEFYRFFAADTFATGEGMSFWLKICRNYPPHDGVDHDLEDFKKLLDDPYYHCCIEEPTEEEFMTKYANLIPSHIVRMVERRDQPMLDWETRFHVNYS